MLTDIEVSKAFKELAEDVKNVLHDRIHKYGVNPKIGKNTLEGSELEKSIDVRQHDNEIAFKIAGYWEFVSRGWERTHRYENTMAQFIRNVDDWVRRKGIHFGRMTQAQMVFLITRNIMLHGLKARPFLVYDEEGDMSKMLPELDDMVDKWFNGLFESMSKNLDEYFNSN